LVWSTAVDFGVLDAGAARRAADFLPVFFALFDAVSSPDPAAAGAGWRAIFGLAVDVDLASVPDADAPADDAESGADVPVPEVSAQATPCPAATAAPNASVAATAPIRPTCTAAPIFGPIPLPLKSSVTSVYFIARTV